MSNFGQEKVDVDILKYFLYTWPFADQADHEQTPRHKLLTMSAADGPDPGLALDGVIGFITKRYTTLCLGLHYTGTGA